MTAVGPRFDPVVHTPPRLQVCGLLAAVDSMDFAAVRDEVGVSDSVLSKHLGALEDAGYVRRRKGAHQGRRTTWVALTSRGRKALSAHVAALRTLIDGIE